MTDEPRDKLSSAPPERPRIESGPYGRQVVEPKKAAVYIEFIEAQLGGERRSHERMEAEIERLREAVDTLTEIRQWNRNRILEEAARAVCRPCEMGNPLRKIEGPDGEPCGYGHLYAPCRADFIHRLKRQGG